MDVVIDTNTWVSGFLWRGTPERVLQLAGQGRFTVWATDEMLEELERVLQYPHLQARMGVVQTQTEAIMARVHATVSIATVAASTPVVLADSTDDIFVHCAVAVGAQYLVSGDKHLLDLKQWQNVLIVRAQEFLQRAFP